MSGESTFLPVGGDDGVGGPGQRAQRGLDLERFDEVAPHLDGVVAATEECEFSVLVETAEISGAITPATVGQRGEAGCGQLRIRVVPGGDVRGFDDDLAGGPRR